MTVYLANGGKITVRKSGVVEFTGNGRVMRDKGRGSFAASLAWVRSIAYGDDVRYVASN